MGGGVLPAQTQIWIFSPPPFFTISATFLINATFLIFTTFQWNRSSVGHYDPNNKMGAAIHCAPLIVIGTAQEKSKVGRNRREDLLRPVHVLVHDNELQTFSSKTKISIFASYLCFLCMQKSGCSLQSSDARRPIFARNATGQEWFLRNANCDIFSFWKPFLRPLKTQIEPALRTQVKNVGGGVVLDPPYC